MSAPTLPMQTQTRSGPQSRASGCSRRPKESVHIAVLFFCFPQRIHGRPLKGRGGGESWGDGPGGHTWALPGA